MRTVGFHHFYYDSAIVRITLKLITDTWGNQWKIEWIWHSKSVGQTDLGFFMCHILLFLLGNTQSIKQWRLTFFVLRYTIQFFVFSKKKLTVTACLAVNYKRVSGSHKNKNPIYFRGRYFCHMPIRKWNMSRIPYNYVMTLTISVILYIKLF
jgi:hypothetical protein